MLDKASEMASNAKASAEAQRAQLAAQQQQAAQQGAAFRQWLISQGKLVEYKVETLREKLIGDKIDHSRLETMLNQYASLGWTLKSITSASVGGRVGPGGVDGLIVVFERPVTQ